MFKSFNSGNRSLQEQLVLFGTGLPWFFLLPFAVYRFIIGDYDIAAVDAIIALSLLVIFYQTYTSKRIKYVNLIAVSISLAGVAYVMNIRGLTMAFWAFPSIGFTYFVLKSKEALLTNLVFIAGITLIFFDALTKSYVLSIYPSLALVCIFGFAFSLCSESQNKKLLRLVTEDTLTGVRNRRSFDEKVEEVIANQKRNETDVSMLVLDLDHFKKINDSFGHKKGDQVLIDFAHKVKSIIRTTDSIYRFGGEEFVVIAKDSDLENSGMLAETIREFITQSPCLSKYEVTVSIGVSQVIGEDDAETWFRRADRALYEAKDSGRNKVCLAMFDDRAKVVCEDINELRKVKPLSDSHELIGSQNNSSDTANSTTVTSYVSEFSSDSRQGINLK